MMNGKKEIWDATRYKCDEDGIKGKYILTGSTVLPEDKKKNIKHSGAGRIKKLKMYPMSLYESGDSTGDISLKDIYDNNVKSKFRLKKYYKISFKRWIFG